MQACTDEKTVDRAETVACEAKPNVAAILISSGDTAGIWTGYTIFLWFIVINLKLE